MARSQVFVPNYIPHKSLEQLQQNFDVIYREKESPPSNADLTEGIYHADGLLCYSQISINKVLLDNAPRLRVVSNVAVGYDNFDLSEMAVRKIVGTNTPGVLTETTADFTFALLLGSARRIAEADEYVKEGQWKSWSPNLLLGYDIYGKTLGIVGMGKIGTAVARRAQGFSMKVLYFNRNRSPSAEVETNAEYVESLDDLLRQSDFVVLLTPLTEKTENLIAERELSLMKSDAILINASRGPVVNENALIRALETGRISGAALDVYAQEPVSVDSPLLRMSQVLTTPHIGSATRHTRERMAELAVKNLTAALNGSRPENIVNPEVWKTAYSR